MRGRSRVGGGWLSFGVELTRTRLYVNVGPYTYWLDYRAPKRTS